MKVLDNAAGRFLVGSAVINGKKERFDYFYPNPLPRYLSIPDKTAKKIEAAAVSLGELKGLSNMVHNINLFISLYKGREAVLSSKIEGTQTSLNDLFLSEARNQKTNLIGDLMEVANYKIALNFGYKKIQEGYDVSSNLINRMHFFLLRGVRGWDKRLGGYRKVQNWIGKPDSNIREAEFVPPSPQFVNNSMNSLFSYMREKSSIPDLVRIALMHYQFESIHPYEDGNGRIGRLLIILYLTKLNVLDKPLLYISPYIESNKELYYALLTEVRRTGDYISWVDFFLDGVAQTAEDTSKKIKQMIGLYDAYIEKLKNSNLTTYEVLDMFFQNPYVSVSKAARILKKNYPLVSRSFKRLKDAGIIKEIHRKRNAIYVSSEILRIIRQ